MIAYLLFIYLRGYIGRDLVKSWVAFVDEQGELTTFKGMFNLLEPKDLAVNDLWPICKHFPNYYYQGEHPLVAKINAFLQ